MGGEPTSSPPIEGTEGLVEEINKRRKEYPFRRAPGYSIFRNNK